MNEAMDEAWATYAKAQPQKLMYDSERDAFNAGFAAALSTQPAEGEVEWGYRSAEGVIGPFPRAPRPSAGYTIVHRVIGPWIEVRS